MTAPDVPKHCGLLVINKPRGLTSRQVVDQVEQWFPGHRVGHAGTLDPLATGVLLVAIGPATRLIEYAQEMPKTYRSVFRLGVVSDTDDADGRIQEVANAPVPSRKAVTDALGRFVGEIEQIPPAYSAVHHEGRRAYEAARRGGSVPLSPRRVVVYDIRLMSFEYPRLQVEIECGKGTYIRSLARDIGQVLGCGAIVEELERRRIGPFRIEDALPLSASQTEAEAALRPATEALSGLPQLRLPDADFARLCQGQAVRYFPRDQALLEDGRECVALGSSLLGVVVAEWQAERHLLIPRKVFRDILPKTTTTSG